MNGQGLGTGVCVCAMCVAFAVLNGGSVASKHARTAGPEQTHASGANMDAYPNAGGNRGMATVSVHQECAALSAACLARDDKRAGLGLCVG
jgi:hypothetical protein